ncbi:MAG: AraC family transcriptional regulator [Eubacteriales bacterium]|nr:AraC family transcriptional regulator [Eubacteriales bacterium]
MDAARREKKEHGTLAFPFQIYPALDGSETDDSDFIPYHWHPELEVITVDSGRVSLTIADQVYEGEHGDVFFAAGEEMHEIRATGRDDQFRSFVFAADFLQFARDDQTEFELLAPLAEGRLRFPTCLRVGEAGQREVRALLAQIVRAWQGQAPGCQLAVKAALLGIVAVCAKNGRLEGHRVRPGADYRARQLKAIVGYLGEHFTEPLPLPSVAAQFGLSPQYFSSYFRENFGRTFTQHVNSLRIEQAARLLRETDLPVMEVGFNVGFDNFSYFIKRFRAVYGVSPSHYRKNSTA